MPYREGEACAERSGAERSKGGLPCPRRPRRRGPRRRGERVRAAAAAGEAKDRIECLSTKRISLAL